MQELNKNIEGFKKEEESPALHFFLYMVSFFALGFSVSGVISIIYSIIEKFISDPSSYSYYNVYSDFAVKYGISSILVAGTVFIIVNRYINKLLFQGNILESSKIRKWLTYIIMFFAASIIIGDLVSIIYNFLGGEMALKFFLKAFTLFLVFGSILSFYFWDMKKRDIVGKKYKLNNIAEKILIFVFLVLVILPFFSISNPFEARRKKIDDVTITRLRRIDDSIDSFYDDKKRLPYNFDDLQKIEMTSSYFYDVSDEDIKDVDYKVVNKTEYKLCTTFLSESEGDYYDSKWEHKKGYHCFSRKIINQDQF